ncbi:tetratricopeptide repeat protein [Plantactinospora sp. S1510]|uniref:Tetratricopeptide repeat protein n=1 Tax=Plantactinospora alkalitolerans TaxID=2789879 RepID=A0ABS0GSH8_9ACTN|nr:BTAD domain-containing putative transcriptional regulator [Plantactinospora alkalitolerans]MBF9128847.1 tetratricopeptide repeat protein [Plantactinospora alkalitolerans]
MELRVLGSLEVRVRGIPVRLGGPRERKLLALMLVHAERAVPLAALVDGMWDEAPPATAKRQVQNLISALRRLLADGSDRNARSPTIVAERDAYRLRLGDAELDARLFLAQVGRAQELAEAGQTGAAAAELRAALRRWHGPPLAGLTGRVLEAAAARLEEQQRAAVEECVDLELRLGRHGELLGELTELVAVHPLRERLVGQLMLALYRSGRQADALHAYRRLRKGLADEFGLDPGPRLQELHAVILASDAATRTPDTAEPPAAVGTPAHRAAPVVPAQLPADVAGFAGRAEQLKELDQLLPGDPTGTTTVAIGVIAGTAGVGKTALAVHWGQRVRHHFPDGQLYVDLRGFEPAGAPVDPADALRGFLDGLGVPGERMPVDLPSRSALYRSLLADRRILVVLDNARDAEQVRPLLPGSPTCLALTTSRHLLPGLVAAEGARPIPLDLFDPGEARQMLAGRLGERRLLAEPQAIDEIITRCGRLPLALAVTAARAAIHSGFSLATLAAELRAARSRLDPFAGADRATDVRAVFSWSYQQLSEPAKRLFRLLGPAPGPDIAVPAAASLVGVAAALAAPVLTELADAHLVTEHAPARYACHDLLRAYAGELADAVDPLADRRAALHRLVDHHLQSACEADRRLDPYRDPITIAPARPGVTSERFADHDAAMNWFTVELPGMLAAVERAAATGFDAHAWQLAWAMAYFLERRGHWRQWAAVQDTALDAARRLDDRAGQAHAHRSLGRVHVHLGLIAEATAHLRLARELYRAAGDVVGEARVHFDLCWLAVRRSGYHDALDHARQALELFRTTDNRSGQARALNNMALAHSLLGDHERALVAGTDALRLNQDIGDRFGEANTWDTLAQANLELGHHEDSIRCYRQAMDLHRDLGHPWAEADVLTQLGDAYEAAGEPGAAEDARQRAVTIFDDLGHPDADLVRAKLTRR